MSGPQPSKSFWMSLVEVSPTQGVPSGRFSDPMGMSYLATEATTLICDDRQPSSEYLSMRGYGSEVLVNDDAPIGHP